MCWTSFLPSLSIIWAELIIVYHLGVIVDIDHIYRPVSVTDKEDGVIIWLQHLKEVNICPTVDENKESKLQHNINQNNTFSSQQKVIFMILTFSLLWAWASFDHTCSLCSRKAVPRSCQPVTGTSVYWTWSQWNSAW